MIRLMLDKPVDGTFVVDWPKPPASLIGAWGGKDPAVLDAPEDVPEEGEQTLLYGFVSVAFVDYRGRDRHKSGPVALYEPLAKGDYGCLDCGVVVSNPPAFPFERCTKHRSGMHRFLERY